MAQTLPIFVCVITFFDIAIIYLACGTPFGVYFYIQNRHESAIAPLVTGVLIRTFLWVPFGLRYLHGYITGKLHISKFADKSSADSLANSRLKSVKKSLERHLLESGSDISLFDFREILDRYCGLTTELKEAQEMVQIPQDIEIYELSNHPNTTLAARCLQRRNLIHLERHQTLAVKDLLKLFADLDLSVANREAFRESSLELAMLLNDRDFEKNLRHLYRSQTQMERDLPINKLENESWISNQQTSNQSYHELKAVTVTASFRKD